MPKNDDNKNANVSAETGVDRTDATQELHEPSGPVPNLDPSREQQPEAQAAVMPTRTDTGTVQGTPTVTHRTVVAEVQPPAPREAAITAPAPLGVASLGPGGFIELARLVYGDEDKALDIFEANRDRITNPDVFVVGTQVRLPALNLSDAQK